MLAAHRPRKILQPPRPTRTARRSSSPFLITGMSRRRVEARSPACIRRSSEFPPLGLLINTTMKQARPVEELGHELFPDAPAAEADTAATVLMALGSMARIDPKGPGLLPCRIHNFFRGLPGLWVCMDAACSELAEDEQSGICGKMYSQPRERCECGARVHELYTCRFCGTAYARAYTDDVDSPSALWSEPGRRLRMEDGETSPASSARHAA